ncbi:2Fe-2S ferredoxin [Synechococcus sp. RS9915]|nr:2Fe-2S ferredoxin [Synechococcus sp. RS9915]
MASFKIELRMPNGIKKFTCPDDEYILEAAEQAGIDMSYSCRAGACSTCVGRSSKVQLINQTRVSLTMIK